MGERLVIGVAGGSGSGKTTLTNRLTERFGDEVVVVYHDNYYMAHDELAYEQRAKLNYDSPEAFDNDLFVEHLRKLKQGQSVLCPVYDYTIHNRSKETVLVEPKRVIIVEGILILCFPALFNLMDIRLFVDADADVRVLRRIERDTKERGRTLESVISQYLTTVKPMHELYVNPSRKNAHLIIPGGGKNAVAIDIITQRIAAAIRGEDGA